MRQPIARTTLAALAAAFILVYAMTLLAVRLDDEDVIAPAPAEAAAPAAADTPPPAYDPENPRQITLAVLDFSEGMHAPGIGRAVGDMLIGALADDPVIRIFERARLDEILQEQRRANPSDKDGNTIRAAREAGVQFVLTGKVSEFGINENGVLIPGKGTVTQYKARTTLDLRLISVADAAIISTWTTTGSETSYNLGVNILGIPNFSFSGRQFEESLLGKSTRQAVNSAADMIRRDARAQAIQEHAARTPLAGKVADVDGKDLVLNIGSLAGMEIGWSVDIMRVHKQVRDPDTGELLLEKRARIATAFVYSVEEKYSRAQVLMIEPGEQIVTGDLAEVQKPGAAPAGQ